jgi:hypothetical protein
VETLGRVWKEPKSLVSGTIDMFPAKDVQTLHFLMEVESPVPFAKPSTQETNFLFQIISYHVNLS